MKAIAGILTVIFCTFGGYAAMGGKLMVLWQPFEVVIIVGSGIGAFIAANPGHIVKGAMGAIGSLFKANKYNKADFIELLSMMFQVFKIAKTKGMMGLEKHIENPHESDLFAQFPKFNHDHHAVEFLCDYLRMISLGAETPHEVQDVMEKELELHHDADHKMSGSIQGMADGLPALGIVAAVLGVIKTMGSISEPPEYLGKLIGGALVGTFLGVWVAYGFVGPMASMLESKYDEEGKYLEALKAGMVAYLQGYAPAICVEYARKTINGTLRPTFAEVEEATSALPVPA